MRRWRSLLGAIALLAVTAPGASAHGVQGRAQSPIPLSAFYYAGAAVLILSFVAVGFGWSRPRLGAIPWRPVPRWLSRVVLSGVAVWSIRAFMLAATGLVFLAAAVGSTELDANLAPVAVFVVFWIGLVPLSALAGNVWREVNPWVTIARILRFPSEGRVLSERVGVWPAVGLLVGFGWFELVYPTTASPRLIAGLIAAYSLGTLAAMRIFGVATWLDRGELFSVFSGTIARLSPIEVRTDDGERRLGLRPPVLGVTRMPHEFSRAILVVAMIAVTAFDGLSGTDFWATRDASAIENLARLGVPAFTGTLVSGTIGLLVTVALLIAVYDRVCRVSGLAGGWEPSHPARRTIGAFAHTLVPIAVAYAVAHYFTLLVFQSQAIVRLASDPLGTGADWLGTANHRIDFEVVSPNTIWTIQVAAIVIGHVVALLLAHDRALELAPEPRRAIRSQYAVLALMVFLTVGGLWSLSSGMAPL